MPTLQEILEHEIKDLYSAESQLVAALPKMQKASASEKLAEAFKLHLEQTKEHKKRIEQIGELLGLSVKGETCKAMQGLVEEGQSIIEEFDESLPRDAALIAAAQRVEHYEISAYGSTLALAQALGHEEVATILESTLNEEKETDVLLTDIAVGEVIPNSLAEEGKVADPNQSGPTRQRSQDDEDDDYEDDDEDEDEVYEDEDEDEEDDDEELKQSSKSKSRTSGKSNASSSSKSSDSSSKASSGRSSGSKKASSSKSNGSKAGKNGKSSSSDMESMTKEELYQLAQEQDLEGRSSMSKEELVKALK